MKRNKRKTVICFVGGVFIVAALADIKYKGWMYQRLPQSIKACLGCMRAA